MAHGADDKVGRAEDEDGDGEELENDASDHDVGPRGGVAIDFVCFGGGHAAADGLNDERDDVAGAENPEVEAWF